MFILGHAAKSHYRDVGGGANTLCLTKNPEFHEDVRAGLTSNARIYGVEYQDIRSGFLDLFDLNHQDAPCAVCEVPRASVLMFPAKRTCPHGWTLEYEGILMSGKYDYTQRTQFDCVSLGMEVVPGGGADINGGLWYVVEVVCVTLPCPPYVNGYELSCVVCSK